ncbi:MAG: hypothetical protein ACTHU0_19130 [Kofleriaceae bacterium]
MAGMLTGLVEVPSQVPPPNQFTSPSPPQAPQLPTPPAQNLAPGENAVRTETRAESVGAVQPTPVAAPAPMPTPEQPPAPQASQQEPAARPTTAGDLRKVGFGGVYDQTREAIEAGAAAGHALADKEAEQQAAFGEAYAKRNEQVDRLFAKREAETRADHDALVKRSADYESAARKWADTKVDRSADHPILAAISVALGGVGAALEGRGGAENPALRALYTAIDRKVAGQMADLERGKVGLGMQKEQIALLREQASDRLAMTNLAIAGESERAARRIEEIAAKSNSEIVRARGAETAAQLRARGAEALGQAVERQTSADQAEKTRQQQALQHRQSIGVQYAQLNQRKAEFGEEMKYKREKDASDRQAALAAAQAKAGGKGSEYYQKMIGENESRGIGNVLTGERLMQPEGLKLMDAAKGHEANAQAFAEQAKAEQDPVKRQQLEQSAQAEAQQASELRGRAEIEHTFRGRTPDQAAKLSDMVSGAQSAVSLIDDIKRMRREYGPSWIASNEGQAAMQSKSTELLMQLKNAWQLGVLSGPDVELINKATGGDPTKLTIGDITSMFGTKGPESRLDALSDGIEKQTRNKLRTEGYRGEWKVNRADFKAAKPTAEESAITSALDDKTPLERSAGEDRGLLRRGVDRIFNPLGESMESKAKRAAEDSGSITRPGLSDSQAGALDLNLRAYRQGGPKAQKAGELLVQLAASSRPTLRSATLNALRGDAPELYEQAIAKLPAEEQEQLRQRDQLGAQWRQQALSVEPLGRLKEAAIAGDAESRAELVRRMAAGDKAAQRAAREVIQAQGRR